MGDRAADVLKAPCTCSNLELVRELLVDGAERKKALEDICMEVIDQKGGELIFNRITGELDRLESLQERFRTWSTTSAASARGSPAAHLATSPHGLHLSLGSRNSSVRSGAE